MQHGSRELAMGLDEESENQKAPLMLLLYFSDVVKVAEDLLSISCHGFFFIFLKASGYRAQKLPKKLSYSFKSS